MDELPDALPVFDRWGPLPRVIHRAAALERGYSRRAIDHLLAGGRWTRILPSVYLTGSTLLWRDRLDAALLLGGPDALLTGAGALADLGLRSVRRPHRVLILVPRTNRARPAGWVRIRRTDRMPAQALLSGPRRAEHARSVADLALERPRLDDVRALVAEAVRADLCTLGELGRERGAGPRQHSRNLRLALGDLGRGAWSAPEAAAASILRRAQVPPFEQNATIHLADGSYVVADALWRGLRAVLEIDSDEHHYVNPADRDRTSRRTTALQINGYSVMSRRPGLIAREPLQFRRRRGLACRPGRRTRRPPRVSAR